MWAAIRAAWSPVACALVPSPVERVLLVTPCDALVAEFKAGLGGSDPIRVHGTCDPAGALSLMRFALPDLVVFDARAYPGIALAFADALCRSRVRCVVIGGTARAQAMYRALGVWGVVDQPEAGIVLARHLRTVRRGPLVD